MSQRFFATFVPGRRGEILDAALEVFGQSGYEAGTMRRIAERVGFTEPALYRHYSSKEALLVDLVSEAGTHLATTAAEHLDAQSGPDMKGALLPLLHERRELLHMNFGLVRTLLAATSHNRPAREAFRNTMFLPMLENMRALIRRTDQAIGTVRTDEAVTVAARAAMSLIVGHLLTSGLLQENATDEELVASLMALMGWHDAL